MSAETILDVVAALCSSGKFGLVVVDSTAALIPAKELEGSVGDQDYALLARAMSKGCKKIVAGCGSTGTTCVFLNQIREKMGVIFGSPETTPGGRALSFFAHQRIQVTPGKVIRIQDGKKEDDKDKGKAVGRKSYVKFVKNKTAAPMGECEMEIIFDEAALNPVVRLCSLAKDYKVLGMRDGHYQIKKDVINAKKNLDTGMATISELADYLVKNNLVITVLDAYVAAMKEDDEEVKPDKDVIAMKDDSSLIKSPLDGKTVSVEIVGNKDDSIPAPVDLTEEELSDDDSK